jgi:hypothetical protein
MLPSKVISLLVRGARRRVWGGSNFKLVDIEIMRPSPRPAVDECLTSRFAGSSIMAGRPLVEFRERGGGELRERRQLA